MGECIDLFAVDGLRLTSLLLGVAVAAILVWRAGRSRASVERHVVGQEPYPLFLLKNGLLAVVLSEGEHQYLLQHPGIELSIDVDQRTASMTIEGLVESCGEPLANPGNPGLPPRIQLSTPEGPRYLYAEMGNGNTTARAGIDLDFKDSYCQFNVVHLNQDGLIR